MPRAALTQQMYIGATTKMYRLRYRRTCHAWSIKCPKHPRQLIEGIPNVKIKSDNRKTEEMGKSITKKSRIHQPITTHDHIINTYVEKINDPKYTNRNEVVLKLKKKICRTIQYRYIYKFHRQQSIHINV